MKGRYIGRNIRLLNDIMEQTEIQNIPGILLLLDFRKAFDTVEWDFCDPANFKLVQLWFLSKAVG